MSDHTIVVIWVIKSFFVQFLCVFLPPLLNFFCFSCAVSQSCLTLCNPMDCSPPGSSIQGDSPDKSTGVGCHTLLQGIFPTQALNPSLPHCRCILYHVRHQGNPYFSQVFTFSVIDRYQYRFMDRRKGKIFPFKCRVPKNSKEKSESLPQ